MTGKTTSPLRYMIAALVVALLQTGVVGYMVSSRAAILRSGTEILLKTVPVDPRDLLRGDYVVLNYEISTIPADKVVGERPPQSGNHGLRVRLQKGADDYWSVSEASFEPLPPQPDSVVASGTAFYDPSWGDAPLIAKYGIERFYVPEGQGRDLESARGTEQLAVAVRVSQAGQAQIRALLLDGKPVHDEPLY
ncbi:GDYXXLXY domain-containing protein [Rhizobiaceae bacterium n13]|uniref:GDYXXLXY domain-containing protein n=1 Tax=Ferirhizobium litorale TaxID=2927786 RepID=A0AAE3QI01_9HYPH|nr:GDYXXLXY domain-containing protein [Fererhizobium litorale]MDI7863935.1 GDYXXLXY domain-containing protein [Fererhizobium litorale]MDI7924233.1 GDYXXLXY domain-containing protein [Fererhizobium litorale]